MEKIDKDLMLDSFGLPTTFLPAWMPDRAKHFIAEAKKGMAATDLVKLAKSRGFKPHWQALPHMADANVFGLGLDVDGLQVPLMVKLVRKHSAPATATPTHVAPPLQSSLF